MASTTDGIAVGADLGQSNDNRVVYYSENLENGIYYDVDIENMGIYGAPQHWYYKSTSGSYSSLQGIKYSDLSGTATERSMNQVIILFIDDYPDIDQYYNNLDSYTQSHSQGAYSTWSDWMSDSAGNPTSVGGGNPFVCNPSRDDSIFLWNNHYYFLFRRNPGGDGWENGPQYLLTTLADPNCAYEASLAGIDEFGLSSDFYKWDNLFKPVCLLDGDLAEYAGNCTNRTLFTYGGSRERNILYFQALEPTTISLTKAGSANPDIKYSYDALSWDNWDGSGLTLQTDQIVFFRGSNTNGWTRSSNADYAYFVTSGKCNVGGDVTSLLNQGGSVATIPCTYCFYRLFYNCKIVDASGLHIDSTTLKQYCYYSMFEGCTELLHVPKLPATNLQNYCYYRMFYGCSKLNETPTLSATSVASYAYSYMFRGCTSLEVAPSLPATTLNTYCYRGMFYGCTKLTTPPSRLPATTAQNYCYRDMFYNCSKLASCPDVRLTVLKTGCCYTMFRGCSSITTSPGLQATSLVSNCYYQMFYNCSKLNYVRCAATNNSGTSYTNNWLYGVASTGTFATPTSASWTTGSASGIPSGWTRITY